FRWIGGHVLRHGNTSLGASPPTVQVSTKPRQHHPCGADPVWAARCPPWCAWCACGGQALLREAAPAVLSAGEPGDRGSGPDARDPAAYARWVAVGQRYHLAVAMDTQNQLQVCSGAAVRRRTTRPGCGSACSSKALAGRPDAWTRRRIVLAGRARRVKHA